MLKASISALFVFAALTAAAQEPQWLQDARAREGKLTKPREIKSKNGWLTAQIPAKLIGDVVEQEGGYVMQFEFNGEGPMTCEVVPDGFDLAGILRATAEQSFTGIQEANGKVEMRALENVQSGVFGDVPYITAAWVYRFTQNGKPVLGGMRQIAMEKYGHGLYCVQLMLGYTKTFDTIAEAFAKSLTTKTENAPKPFYHEISTIGMNGRKVGIAQVTLERDAEGAVSAIERSSIFVPAPGGTMNSQDSMHQQWTNADAELINARHIQASNDQVVVTLDLSPIDGVWIVEGEASGKPVKTALPEDAGEPGTYLRQSRELRAILAGKDAVGSEHSVKMWLQAFPTELKTVKTKITGKSGEYFTAQADLGGLSVTMTLDPKTGNPVSVDVPAGAQMLKIERVYQMGSF